MQSVLGLGLMRGSIWEVLVPQEVILLLWLIFWLIMLLFDLFLSLLLFAVDRNILSWRTVRAYCVCVHYCLNQLLACCVTYLTEQLFASLAWEIRAFFSWTDLHICGYKDLVNCMRLIFKFNVSIWFASPLYNCIWAKEET